MDGKAALARIREWSQVPVIVLSVRASEAEKVAALDAGAQDYVVKPFGVQELLARIRGQLRDRAAPRHVRDARRRRSRHRRRHPAGPQGRPVPSS